MKKNQNFVLILFLVSIQFTYGQTNDPVILGYFPSWSETWASSGTNSILREIPSHVNHVFLSFAKPNLTYVQGSYDISDTGIQTPYDGCTLKESVKVLSDKGTKVILSIGGETYWNSPSAYNINYQQIKDLVDDMGFAGIDWDYEPDGSFSGIGTATNVQNFIDFITFSRALMPKAQGYIIACAPSGVGALGGQTNDDAASPFSFANRNTLTGETDANLYNATVPTNGINMFGFSATGHMIPVFAAVGNDIDLVAYQGYNLGASTNRTLMYDAFAYYAEIHGFKVAAGVHYPDEPWGPYYTYTHSNVASLSTHISNAPNRIGDGDGIMIWQLLMTGATSSAYSYMHVASDVLNGDTEANAIANANNFTVETYTGGSEISCFCLAPSPSLGSDQNICGVPSITLNSNIAPQAGVTFTWKLNGSTIVASSPTQNTYTITQAGTYTVEVEENGCSNTDVVIITDNIPAFNLGSNVNICPNGSAVLNTGFSDPSYSYVWTQNTVVIPNETSSNYTATSAGIYEVSVNATGCSSSSDNLVVSDDLPAFDLGGSVNLCSPATATLNTGFTDPSYSYVWTMDENLIPEATNASYVANSAGAYEVSVNATGCSSATENVIITSSLPLASNDTICSAGTINLIANQNVEWYDTSTGGTLLNTGTSYSPTISSSTDYWITEGNTTQSFTTLRSAFQGGGWQQFPYVYGTKMVVSQDLTLDNVTVDAGGGDVTINVVANDGTTIVATTTVTGISGLANIPLNFALSPGTYYLNTVNSTSNFYVDVTPANNYNNAGVLLVEGEAYWDWGSPSGANYVLSGDYGVFTNLSYSVGSNCDRVLVSGVIDPSNSACSSCTDTPNNIQVNVTTSTSAIVTWDAVPESTNYQVWYRIKGTSSWVIKGGSSPQRNLTNLTKNKYYQYKVRASCASGWADFSDIDIFYSSICGEVPTGIASIYLDNTRMRIRWDNIDEVKAKVRYREVGTSTWYTQNSADGNNYVYINGLTPNATYQYRVRSNCEGNNWSAYSASYFHDLSGGGARMAASGSSTNARIYPNPVNDILNVEFETDMERDINISVFDQLGKVVHTINESYLKGSQKESIDMSSFANGYYFIRLQGDDMMQTFKFAKVR